jgi:hypothetical protein
MWRRRLFVTLSTFSLMLCIGLGAVWLRSYRKSECWFQSLDDFSTLQVGEPAPETFTVVFAGTVKGAVLAGWQRETNPGHGFSSMYLHTRPTESPYFSSLGFGLHWRTTGPPTKAKQERVIVLPIWCLILLTAAMPIQCYRLARGRWLHEKRRGLGLCERCGYDLRATPERCPECGAVKDLPLPDAQSVV